MKHALIPATGIYIRQFMLAALASVLLQATGCQPQHRANQDQADSANTTGQDSASGPASSEARPATIVDTVYHDTMPETVHLTLVQDELPFSTYIPDSAFTLEKRVNDDGISALFTAYFDGQLISEAALYIFVSDGRFTLQQMESMITGPEGVAIGNDWHLEKVDGASIGCDWAAASYTITGLAGAPGIVGRTCISTHNGRPFYIIAVAPKKYAPELMERAAMVLSHLRWKDTGAGLARE